MPYGKGTYGSRVGRPARKKKDTKSVKRLARNTATANQEGEGRVYGMGEESGLEDYRRGSKKTNAARRRRRQTGQASVDSDLTASERGLVDAAMYAKAQGRESARKKHTDEVRKRIAARRRAENSSKNSELKHLVNSILSERNGARRKATSKTGISAHSVESGEVHFDPNRPGQERSSRVQVSKRGPIVRISRR